MSVRIHCAGKNIKAARINDLLRPRESGARVKDPCDLSLLDRYVGVPSPRGGNHLTAGNKKIQILHHHFPCLPYSFLIKPDSLASWTKLISTKSFALALAASGRPAAI